MDYTKGFALEFASNTINISELVTTATALGPILNPGKSSSKYRIKPAPVEGIGAFSFLLRCFLSDDIHMKLILIA